MAALMSGSFERAASRVVAEDVINKWAKATQVVKEIAVRAFWRYLVAVGLEHKYFPADGSVPTKSPAQTHAEERSLANWALLRGMAGQMMSGVEGYVSHVRTWYRTTYRSEFGQVGCRGNPSITSQYIKSMSRLFPPTKKTTDERREPITWPMVQLFLDAAERERWAGNAKWGDAGVAIHTAFAGLFRMGELTATSADPFDPAVDLCEDSLLFDPTFWTATGVTIQLGSTKADQSGERDARLPRMLPIDTDKASPGRTLRDMIARRHGVRKGQEPTLGRVPLFQDGRGGQLSRDGVLTFIRKSLKSNGMSKDRTERFGTHSARIGGATALFRLGASDKVFQRLGGWASDAHKEYVRIQQRELMQFARRMCR
jgi:hypothetical protein